MDSAHSDRRRFARDLHWVVPLWLAVAVGLGAYVGVTEDKRSGVEMGGGMIVLGIALAPVIWLRRSGSRPAEPGEIGTVLKRVGLAMAWAFAVLIVSVTLASALD